MPNFKCISFKMAVLQGGGQNLPSPCVCYPKDPMWNRVKNATDVATFESFISEIPKTSKIRKFRKVKQGEVTKAMAELKNSRAGMIPSRFLKDASSRIAFPLASIFSKSLKIVAFPDTLK